MFWCFYKRIYSPELIKRRGFLNAIYGIMCMFYRIEADEISRFRESFRASKPFKLRILKFKLTDVCNSKCSFCSYWRNNINISLPTEKVLDILQSAKKLGCRKVTFSGGEPTFHSGIPKFFETAFGLGYHITLITNGILFSKKWPELIKNMKKENKLTVVFSLDGSTGEIHDVIRGFKGGFDITMEGIRIVNKAKEKYPNIQLALSTTVSKLNFRDIKNIIRLKKQIGFDTISFYPTRNFVGGTGLASSEFNGIELNEFIQQELPIIEKEAEQQRIPKNGIQRSVFLFTPKKGPKNCYLPFFQAEIDSSGEIYGCCHALEYRSVQNTSFGNVNSDGLEKVWNGEKASWFRKKCHNVNFSFCNGCIYKMLNSELNKTI